MPASSSASSSGCIARKISRARGWGWRRCNASSRNMAARCGRRQSWTAAPPSTSACPGRRRKAAPPGTGRRRFMRDKQVEILLVEDNPKDVELAVHALRREKLANHVDVVRDGEEALDYLFCRGAYADRNSVD